MFGHLKRVGVSLAKVERAIAFLSDEKLARLAVQAEKIEKDPNGAGAVGIAIALIIIAVAALVAWLIYEKIRDDVRESAS